MVCREKRSGAYRDRPELNRLLDQLRKGDTVTVWKLDRLARPTRNLLEIVEQIGVAGAHFQSIFEPWADTTTHASKMIMTTFAGIAEFERDLIRERPGAGRAKARRPLQPPVQTQSRAAPARPAPATGNKSVREVARAFQVQPATLYRVLARSPKVLPVSRRQAASDCPW